MFDITSHIIYIYPYCLKDYRLFVQLKMAWNFIFAFLSGTWRGFGGDGIDLHKAFLGVPRRVVGMKIFILTFSLVQHWNRRSIININEFLTTSPRAIPLVLASLCGIHLFLIIVPSMIKVTLKNFQRLSFLFYLMFWILKK